MQIKVNVFSKNMKKIIFKDKNTHIFANKKTVQFEIELFLISYFKQ